MKRLWRKMANMFRVWITGAEGHVGTALTQILDCREYRLLTTDIKEVDITDLEQVKHYVRVYRPDVIINCAGLTDVAYCETHMDEAYKVNALGVRNIALAASDVHARVIQISTDDVFDMQSHRPYNEFDATHPRTIYGKSKEAGEKVLSQLCKEFTIIRSSWIYGIGRDFVDEVLRAVGNKKVLEVPDNSYAVPTSSKELAKMICHFIDHEEYGIYHAVCKGSCSRYEFAQAILEYAGKTGEIELKAITSADNFRPEYSVLDNMMLRLSGIEEPAEWRTALREYLEERGGME